MRFVWRITLGGDEYGLDHVGLGKWVEGQPVALLSAPLGPFDTEWDDVVDQMEGRLDEQLTLF